MGKTVDQVLAENLNRLITSPGSTLASNAAVEKRSGVGQATVDRARKSQPGLSIAKVEAIARAFGLEAWQLLAPNLGAAPTPAPGDQLQWPFPRIRAEDLQALDEVDLGLIEERITTLLDRAKRPDAKKSTSAA